RSVDMASVTVLRFTTATGADETLDQVKQLQEQNLITLHDAAIVSWPGGQQAPKTRQLYDLVSGHALGGMFWGILFGLIFVTPFFGMALGGAVGAIGGALGELGNSREVIQQHRRLVS